MKINTIIAAPFGLLLGVALLTFAAVVLQPATATAHDADRQTAQNNTRNEQPRTSGKTYEYVAQPGDSYSKMARKAVQTYGIVNKVNLSGAQIIFAETNLTQAAGSPVLNLGEKVSIPQDTVKEWIEKAQKLTDTQKAAWNYYVQFVNFNTNNVGESRS